MIKADMLNFSQEETQEKSSENTTTLTNSLGALKLLTKQEELAQIFEEFSSRKLKSWTYSSLKDEFRPDYASKSTGGIEYTDKKLVSMMRSSGYDIIKQIGKKILTGDFNLTTISFPIKVMLPVTILQSIGKSIFQFPIYMNLAANQIDPLERFKLLITGTVACFHANSDILKPLNPILGETHIMKYEDGSVIYLEQSSHHPPVSHYLMHGPNKNYTFSGYSNFSSSAGLNSLKLYNKGKRHFKFSDGTQITTTFSHELYSNTFFGTVRHESLGDIVFKDLTNGLECIIKLGAVKKKPSDFFAGEIRAKNITVCKVYGSYLSYLEFNNIRYWDIRENIPVKKLEFESNLNSESLKREDRILLELGRMDEAQKAKEKLEEIQRADRKLREKFQKSKK